MATDIITNQSNWYNSAFYQPISMKFEAQIQNGMSILANEKPEVHTGNKMVAAVFVELSKKL